MAKPAAQRAPSANYSDTHHLRRTAAALAVAACFSTSIALANPTNPTVIRGTATFDPAGNILNITNSHNAVINWGSFSIGINELTKFIQPSALSAVLNRVIGQDPSAILGALQSNGRVFLINPNGITFGAGAQIDVAGLVASTLKLSDDDFLNNRLRFTDGAVAGSVVNQGSITGGSVYLVGKATTNDGLITSPNGVVVLAAGNSVELVNPGTPDLRVEIVAPDNAAMNLGTIAAEAGRIGIYAGLINNSGTLNASSAVAEGGRILLKATMNTTLAASSILDASGVGGGRIDVLADDTVQVDGRIDASAPIAGNGGFIETSGKNRVKIADSAVITTIAPQGITGTWLIDPADLTIGDLAYGGDITGATLSTMLGGTNVLLTSDGLDSTPTPFTPVNLLGNGDIFVNQPVSWTADTSLTLLARRNVTINSSIDGGGDLIFMAGWNGASTATPVVTSGVGDITSAFDTIQTKGNIHFEAGRDILLGASTVQAGQNSLGLAGNGLAKSVNLIAGRNIELTNPEGGAAVLAIGNKGGSGTVILQAKTGSITVQGSEIQAKGGDGSESAGGDATVTLCTGALAGNTCTSSALGRITVSDSAIGAVGGSGSSGKRGGDATVKLTAGSGGIQISGSGFVYNSSGSRGIYAIGGQGDNANNFGEVGGRGGDALVQLASTGGITVEGPVESEGGVGGRGNSGSGGRGGHGKVMMNAAGTLGVTGQVGAVGGSGGFANSGSNTGGRGGDALVQLISTGAMTVDGSVYAYGGWAGNGFGGGGDGGSATVEMTSAGMTTISNSYIQGQGGDGAEGGAGGAGTVTVTAGGGLMVSNTIIDASGGNANGSIGTRQGGAATIVLNATGGSIQMEGAEGTARGGSGDIGGSAVNALFSAGNITVTGGIDGSVGAFTTGTTPGPAAVILAAAGDITIDSNAWVWSHGDLGIAGANILLDNALAWGNSSLVVGATGNLDVVNGTELIGGLGGTGNATIGVGGNMMVDSSFVAGNPDVVMSVLGTVNMNNGGVIEAGAPSTIHLAFPLLSSGGYFVNGVEGVVYDELTSTGFRADGLGAILDTNLLITYGGGPVLNIPTDALLVAMGESTKPPDAVKDKDIFAETEDEKKKDAPMCR